MPDSESATAQQRAVSCAQGCREVGWHCEVLGDQTGRRMRLAPGASFARNLALLGAPREAHPDQFGLLDHARNLERPQLVPIARGGVLVGTATPHLLKEVATRSRLTARDSKARAGSEREIPLAESSVIPVIRRSGRLGACVLALTFRIAGLLLSLPSVFFFFFPPSFGNHIHDPGPVINFLCLIFSSAHYSVRQTRKTSTWSGHLSLFGLASLAGTSIQYAVRRYIPIPKSGPFQGGPT